MRGWIVAVALVLAAGCGGEQEADSWARDADAACRDAERAIAKLGTPSSVNALSKASDVAEREAYEAVDRIRELEPPGDVERALNHFLMEFQGLAGTVRYGHPDKVTRAVKQFRVGWQPLEHAANRAGLEVCGRPEARRAVEDAVLTPVFAQQLRDLENRIGTDLMVDSRRRTFRSVEDFYDQFGAVLGIAVQSEEILLKMEPPSYVLDAVDSAGRALGNVGDSAYDAMIAVEEGEATTLRQVTRHHDRMLRSLDKAQHEFGQLADSMRR